MDSKLDSSLQSDRAAGKAAELRLFWAVCCQGLRHGRGAVSGPQPLEAFQRSAQNTLGRVFKPMEDVS